MTIKRYTYLIIYIIATFFFAACTSDDVEREKAEGEMAHVTMSLCTRATGTPESATESKELIHTWWVAFVNKTGNVQKVVSRSTAHVTGFEEESVELDIPTGTYTLYAFANITPSLYSANSFTIEGLTFTEGESYPSAVETKTMTLANDWPNDIPMTGKQLVTVTGRANEVFSVEVVRMLAKMEFQFRNESISEITVNNLTMTKAPTDVVPLLPNYTYLESGWPITADGTSNPLVRTYTSKTLAGFSTVPASGFTDIFYMIESQANYNFARRYMLNVNVTRTGSGHSDDYMYALTKNLESIYRNDHVIIPIVLSDYMVDMEVNFYPPIGGYPAVISRDESKQQFFCEFATQGEFAVRPHVLDAANGYSLVYKEDGFSPSPYYSYVITAISDPKPIFTGTPAIESTSGEILGRLNTNEGTAYIDVRITVKRTSGADQIYDRRIYIIRKNP